MPSKEIRCLANYVICTIPYKNDEIKNFQKKQKNQKFYLGADFTILREQFYKPKVFKTKRYIL